MERFSDQDITIRHQLMPGDVGAILRLHGELYAREYGFDSTFEAYVAQPLAEFVIHHGPREKIWIVEHQGDVLGSMAIVQLSEETAQLRWLLLHPDLRGKKTGKHLVLEGITFSREQGYASLILWTADLLLEAAALYRATGFSLTETKKHRMWGVELTEQKYELKLR